MRRSPSTSSTMSTSSTGGARRPSSGPAGLRSLGEIYTILHTTLKHTVHYIYIPKFPNVNLDINL